MQIFLQTERLILRRFIGSDVDNLCNLDGDPDVMRFINGGIPTPRDEIEHDYLPAFLAYYERGDRYGFWAAIEKSSGEFLGWFHFRPGEGSGPNEPELGYRLRKSAWGKGYATEGSKALIHKGFNELGAERIVASAYEANTASRRVMEKVGMTLVRTYPVGQSDPLLVGPERFNSNGVDYALEKDDWERQG
jgi:RimJ/RimL family protein N-acetyltransferase